MSNALEPAKGLAQAAYLESLWVAVVIPGAVPIVPIVYEAQGDPAKIWDAADGWKETIDEMESAQRKIEELSRRVSESAWEGDDRTAFEQRMHDYVNQLDAAIVMAWAVAISLWVLAVLIGVFIYLMFLIMTLLAIFATAICVAAGTIVGAPAALEMEAQANQFAAMAHRVLSVGSQMLTYTFWGTGAIMTAFLGGNMAVQFFKGNKDVLTNFGESVVNSRDDVLKGTIAYAEQKGTKWLMGGFKNPANRLGIPPGPPRSAPLTIPEKIAGTKGTVDSLGEGPTVAGLVSGESPYGTAEDEEKKKGKRDPGLDYVDRTQPGE